MIDNYVDETNRLISMDILSKVHRTNTWFFAFWFNHSYCHYTIMKQWQQFWVYWLASTSTGNIVW